MVVVMVVVMHFLCNDNRFAALAPLTTISSQPSRCPPPGLRTTTTIITVIVETQT